MPKHIIAKLNAAAVEALADPAVQSRLADLGTEVFPRERQTAQALGALHRAQIENGGRSSRSLGSRRSEEAPSDTTRIRLWPRSGRRSGASLRRLIGKSATAEHTPALPLEFGTGRRPTTMDETIFHRGMSVIFF
jgi:hypothetical protein